MHSKSTSIHRGPILPPLGSFYTFCTSDSRGSILIQRLLPPSLPLAFVSIDTTWLKPCTLSIFICHFMLYCSLTLHSPKALVFHIKHICLLALSEIAQFSPFRGFSPFVLQFTLSRRVKSHRMWGLLQSISATSWHRSSQSFPFHVDDLYLNTNFSSLWSGHPSFTLNSQSL